jgi:hypothetical protein
MLRLVAVTALAVSFTAACTNDEPAATHVTAQDLPALVPDADDVRALLGVEALESRENEALTQALEGLDARDHDALDTYGHGYTSGDPNSADPWSAAGVLLALAPTADDAARILDELTAGPDWSDAQFPGPGDGQARRASVSPDDGFAGELLVLRAGPLLVHITVIGSPDEPRGETVDGIAREVLARIAALDD